MTILDQNKIIKSNKMLLPLKLNDREPLPSTLEYKLGNLVLQNSRFEIYPINLEVSQGQKIIE